MTVPYFNLAEEAFRVQKIEFMNPVPRHKHSCYELFFISHGEGTFYIDCQTYQITANTLFLVSPGRVHGWEKTHDLHAYLLKFDLSIFVDKFLSDHLSIFHFDTLKLSNSEAKSIEMILLNLQEEYMTSQSFKECTISNLLQILLIYIQRALPAVATSHTTNILVSKLDELMEHNNYQITPCSYYAKKLKTSEKLLNQAVQELTGLHCGEYIRSKTVLEAKRLLKYGTLTCNEIADHLGFIDPGYFSRFFKREVGTSPKAFRNMPEEKCNF